MPPSQYNLAPIKGKVPREVEQAFIDVHQRIDGMMSAVAAVQNQVKTLPTADQLQQHTITVQKAVASNTSFDATVAGVSSSLKQQTSILPTVSGAFAYTSTGTTITWYWDGTNGSFILTILWPDGSQTPVPPANLAITGLANTTTYVFYPYFDVVFGGVKFVVLPSGSGTPQAAFLASNQAAAAVQSADNHAIMVAAAMTAATTAGGGGGGSGGGSGGGCIREGTEVVPVGGMAFSYLMPWDDWLEIKTLSGHCLQAGRTHRIFTEEGCLAMRDLQLGARIVTAEGISSLHEIKEVHERARKQLVWVPKGSLYWSNGILSHNAKPF
jgi:hypothetical protein